MSRIELDAADRGSVGRAREVLATARATDYAALSRADLLMLVGDLQGQLGIVLRVVEGGEVR
ncbi:hypothetical protein KYY02_19345 [Streptomyces pimonensis]|uniref:Uncharacterized protein n=1 Tax=Streptomyces pimonensis TaxID=2860288 RepID=A0ABV4J1S0_9ACTN